MKYEDVESVEEQLKLYDAEKEDTHNWVYLPKQVKIIVEEEVSN